MFGPYILILWIQIVQDGQSKLEIRHSEVGNLFKCEVMRSTLMETGVKAKGDEHGKNIPVIRAECITKSSAEADPNFKSILQKID